MCHWVREPNAERRSTELSVPPSEMMSQRPRRLVGAVAAAAAVAVAGLVALLFPSSTTAVLNDAKPAAAVDQGMINKANFTADDEVPVTTPGRSGGRHCDHDM